MLEGTPDRNGLLDRLKPTPPKRARKPKPTALAEDKPAGPDVPKPAVADPLLKWAHVGIALSVVLSAGLNGYANAQHATVPWAGWLIGFWVPALVIVFARVAGGSWVRGWRVLAMLGAAVVLALLALSVSHCARAFAQLTGADGLSSILMAIGIDCGLVVCELMTVSAKKRG